VTGRRAFEEKDFGEEESSENFQIFGSVGSLAVRTLQCL